MNGCNFAPLVPRGELPWTATRARAVAPQTGLPARHPHNSSLLGQRVHVVGSSCSGKTTLASRLAGSLEARCVDLDAINWLPNWVSLNDTDRVELERRFRAATQGERWVSAGSYTATAQRAFWPRLHAIIWLDLPAALLVWRCLRRSWRRWRAGELLWGTNVERFWPQLAVWRREESLLWWIVTQHQRKRRNAFAAMADPRWAHIRFVRLRSPRDVEDFAQEVERQAALRGVEGTLNPA